MVLRRVFKDNARDLEEHQEYWWYQEPEYRGVLYFKLSESSIGLFLVSDYEVLYIEQPTFLPTLLSKDYYRLGKILSDHNYKPAFLDCVIDGDIVV